MKGNNKGITLIALVVTIIVLIILAGISLNLILGDNGLVERTKWSSFGNKMSSIEEAVLLAMTGDEADNILKDKENSIVLSEDSIFVAKYNDEQITDKLKRDIVELRENKPNSGMSQEEINQKYDNLKGSDGTINGLFYINKKYADGKDRTYLFDTVTKTVIKVPGEIIFGEEYHIFKGNSIIGNSKNPGSDNPASEDVRRPEIPDIKKPEGAVLPEHKPLEEGWIPIYTVENYKKVASEEQNYDIYDLKGTKVGTYNMNKDAKYRLMNDIDFAEETVDPIKGFKGTFDGNGYYIKNIKVNNENTKEDTYHYYSKDNFVLSESDFRDLELDAWKIGAPTGLFDRIESGKVENLGIDNANVVGNAFVETVDSKQKIYASNVGILAGEIVGTTIENCIIQNSYANSKIDVSTRFKGPVGALVGWVYDNGTSTKINKVKVDNTEIVGTNVTSGLVAVTTANIEITECLLENSTINYQSFDTSSSSESQGGILGLSYAAAHNITNCYVGSTIFTNNMEEYSNTSSAGILGGLYNPYINGSYIKQDINISKCIVENCEFALAMNGSGICGNTGWTDYNPGNILNITDCLVSNIKLNSASAGAMLGYSVAKNVNIENCNAKELEYIEDTHRNTNRAGIAGIIYYSENINIKNCNVVDSNIVAYDPKDQMTITAGILATNYGYKMNKENSIIKDCTIYNTTIKTKINGTNGSNSCKATGIIGVSSGITIDNCNIGDSYIILEAENQYTGSTSTGDISCGYAAGIVGDNTQGNYSSGQNHYTQNCKISNTEITSNYGSAYGIFAGIQWGSANQYIVNCDILNSTIQGKRSVAGVTNYASATNLTIDSCDMTNCDIISEELNAAGILNMGALGYSDTIPTIIKNCNVIKCNIGNLNYTTLSKNANVGGIVSYAQAVGVEDCKVKDCEIKNVNTDTGGILGIAWSNANITGCIVENTNITSDKENTGLIVGMAGTKCTIENCQVIGGKINTKGVKSGGIIGYTFGKLNIQDSKVKGAEINSDEGIIGGIVGATTEANDININNCNVENIKITTKGPIVGGIAGYYKGNLSNSNVKSSIISAENYEVGGLVGNKDLEGNIENCTVESTQITGKDRAVGGLVGQHIGTGIINNSTIKNSKVTISGADAKGVGGIVGYGSNIIYNFTQYSYTTTYDSKNTITNCKVLGTEITGIDYVGGISGVATVLIDGCIIDENSIIKGRNFVGGLQGFGGILGDTSSITHKWSRNAYVSSSNRYLSQWEDRTISPTGWYASTMSNCQVNNTSITGTTDAKCFEGKESYYTNGYVGTQSQDKIINSTNKNVTINGVLHDHIHTEACYHTHIGDYTTQGGCYTGASYTTTAGVYNVEGWEEEIYYRAYYHCAGCGTKIKMWYEGQKDPNTGVITENYKNIEPGLRGCCDVTAYALECEYKDSQNGETLMCGYN